jgi:hypothetical protein
VSVYGVDRGRCRLLLLLTLVQAFAGASWVSACMLLRAHVGAHITQECASLCGCVCQQNLLPLLLCSPARRVVYSTNCCGLCTNCCSPLQS